MVSLALVGEAWGKDEVEAGGQPFVGAAGRVLNGLLAQVGIARSECYITNTFNLRPQPTNAIVNLCGPKADGIPGRTALTKGKFVRAEYAPELDRLYSELRAIEPNLIVAFGATPTWALLGTSGIREHRGTTAMGRYVPYKVLPTYHPAALFHEWDLRPIVLQDLMKAKTEREFPEVRRPRREVWVEPSYEDLLEFHSRYIYSSQQIAIDIETASDMITCIGFAPDAEHALVVPFVKNGKSYWPTPEDEVRAWNFVRAVCGEPKQLIFQNGLYDMHFLWRTIGITCPHAAEDTMLLHHALQPEMKKGLGFLGTIYTNEASWKMMRKGSKTAKRED